MNATPSEKNPPGKTERRDRYAAPAVRTYSSHEILDSIGPAQGLTSGVSPEVVADDSSHSHGRR